VRARVEGPRPVIEEYVRALEKGPPLSSIANVSVRWLPATNRFVGFDIRYSSSDR